MRVPRYPGKHHFARFPPGTLATGEREEKAKREKKIQKRETKMQVKRDQSSHALHDYPLKHACSVPHLFPLAADSWQLILIAPASVHCFQEA